MHFIDVLLSRVSVPLLQSPGPDDQQLRTLISAALTAPDHARLKPWRFLIVRADRREQLGVLLEHAALQINPDMSEEQRQKMRAAPFRAPVLLLPILTEKENIKVPVTEQLLSLGAAVSNILNAAHALNIGAMWRTGLPSYASVLAKGLGLQNHESLHGFIYLGTPSRGAKRPERPAPDAFVREW